VGRLAGRGRGDDGQVATAVMIVVTVGLVAVTGLGVLRLGAAVDERGQAQTAADAAALGGAEAAREGLPALFAAVRSAEDLEAIGDALTCGVGREGAVELASANGAEVTSYCYDSFTDRVEVEVVNRATGDAATGTATAGAVASLGLLIDECTRSPDPSATPSAEPGPEPSEPPEPGEVTLACGDLTVEFEQADDGELRLVTPPEELAERLESAFEPRLVE
jgi:hypothetical protein